eukprot:CAMPEP_0114577094 /NCGR_PEP_ID=MMETSP0125-20121206/1792_1 /TAXON_ID=485358 ORGANISM="Aristerostoma sp., Strain ATCC 50986" /NCGR_SAMPLE_ID=MMETSP0125 /ASSEMBLY_ACC=CAM_ASM_000245 /LENGTH=106 /DNA_ID=CAMNT_0001766137 /DNA_START=1164 /DNA_END=1484 /DNA_ORIENTATION=-
MGNNSNNNNNQNMMNMMMQMMGQMNNSGSGMRDESQGNKGSVNLSNGLTINHHPRISSDSKKVEDTRTKLFNDANGYENKNNNSGNYINLNVANNSTNSTSNNSNQ